MQVMIAQKKELIVIYGGWMGFMQSTFSIFPSTVRA
jgi:hypothetical protein